MIQSDIGRANSIQSDMVEQVSSSVSETEQINTKIAESIDTVYEGTETSLQNTSDNQHAINILNDMSTELSSLVSLYR
ncbi:MAG: hypothetical protein AB8B63_08595 [Granulosicoccus sp.]